MLKKKKYIYPADKYPSMQIAIGKDEHARLKAFSKKSGMKIQQLANKYLREGLDRDELRVQ